MSVLKTHVRRGGYFDSIILMQLQAALAELPGVLDAGAVMATPDNCTLLTASELLPASFCDAGPTDLLIAVKAESEIAAEEALSRVDALRRTRAGPSFRYPAASRLPWPGRRWIEVSAYSSTATT